MKIVTVYNNIYKNPSIFTIPELHENDLINSKFIIITDYIGLSDNLAQKIKSYKDKVYILSCYPRHLNEHTIVKDYYIHESKMLCMFENCQSKFLGYYFKKNKADIKKDYILCNGKYMEHFDEYIEDLYKICNELDIEAYFCTPLYWWNKSTFKDKYHNIKNLGIDGLLPEKIYNQYLSQAFAQVSLSHPYGSISHTHACFNHTIPVIRKEFSPSLEKNHNDKIISFEHMSKLKDILFKLKSEKKYGTPIESYTFTEYYKRIEKL
jgi:hypothetical protein